MVNRFKFRLWNKKDKKFIRSQNIQLNQDGMLYDNSILRDVTNDYIVMQSTGFFDNNGKEIFEGDILENKDCSDSRVKVVFLFPSNINGNRFGFYLENLETYSVKDFLNKYTGLDILEVIGNIYENKDLIKE